MEITKIDINKNSIPTQRHKNTRFPTPIKHRFRKRLFRGRKITK